MKKFHVIKLSRVYDGNTYCGVASDFVAQEFELLDDAIDATKKLLERNQVGLAIFDSQTKEQVFCTL